MNTDDALQQFCRQNLKTLTSRDLSRDDFKTLVREHFYSKLANKFGQPSIKEIQQSLVGLLKRNGVGAPRIASIIQETPLFSDISESFRDQMIASLTEKQHDSALSADQIDSIKKIGAYRTLEFTKGEQIEQAKQAALEELERQIETKRQEYDALPSLLEQSPVEEPEFQPATEESKPWWERFYLKADPFPRKDGLSSIAEDMYEAVITKTEPFKLTLSALDRNPAHLFHTGFLLVGGYGYGKTTFIDYLSHYLINGGILPVRITCTRCSADASGFSDSFFHRLRKVLMDEASKITHVDSSHLADLEVEDQVTELIKMITSRKRGVIIFLDDYHKFASHFTQIYEFLGTLQVLKDSLTRKGFPAGFIVSGIPDWKQELERNSQLSGFLDSPSIEMPDVSTELVCEVFNRRIKAYCYEGAPRLIKSDFVHKLVKEFAGKAGFRDYIGKIVNELSHNNYAIVDSPIEISEEQLAIAKNMIESDSHLKIGITRLVHLSAFKRFNQEQIAKTLELIVHIGMQGGITESDRQFISNRFYFQTLKDCGLIQKQRSSAGEVSWALHSRMKRISDSIFEKLGLSLQDYLLKVYAFKGYSGGSKAVDSVNSELTALKQFFGNPELKLTASVEQNLALGLRVLESLAPADSSRRRDADHLQSAYVAVTAFSDALFTLDGAALLYAQAGITDLSTQWEMHPANDEIITESFTRFNDYRREKTPHRLALALKQMKEAAYLTAEGLKQLLDEQTARGGISLLHRPLAHAEEEIKMFAAVLEGKYSTRGEDHFDYIRRVTDWLELRFRSFFYLTGNLLFGQNYIEQCPRTVVNYAYKNLETRVVFNSIENRFDGLTRSQYRQILCEGNPFKDLVVGELSLAWKTEDWTLFGELFVEINIETAHLQIAAFDVTLRSRYMRYCSMAEELTAAMNACVSRLLDRSVYFLTVAQSNPRPEEVLLKYDFRALKIKELNNTKVCSEWPRQLDSNQTVKDHGLTAESYERVYKRLNDKLENSPNGSLIIDLLNVEYLADHYRVSILDLVNSLAYIAHFEKTLAVKPWMGSSLIVRRH